MKFIVHTDENNYVVSLELNPNGIEVAEEVFKDQICWKYENGKFTFDAEKKKTLIKAAENMREIEMLKKELSSTDYKAIKHSEGLISDEEYEATKLARQELRNKINELEKEI